jgi:hypothetical protein
VARFDTDARAIRIDNCASYCISNDKKDFITPLKKLNKKLKGLGRTLADIYSGTIKWSIEDDDGVPHDWVIPNGLYVKGYTFKAVVSTALGPDCSRLTSLCQEVHGVQHIMIAFSFSGLRRKFTKTVRLSGDSGNVATLYTASKLSKLLTPSATCVRWKWMRTDPIINVDNPSHP